MTSIHTLHDNGFQQCSSSFLTESNIYRFKNRRSDVSPHPVNRVSAGQSHIKSCGGDGHTVWTQTLPDLVCRKINTFLWLSKIIAAVKVPLKASDWPSIACGSWLDCVFREGGREWNAAEREGIRAERLPSAEAELIEREGRQRASQNTKCLNCNTLENSRAPKNRRASPFSNLERVLAEKACEKLVALQSKSRSWYGRFNSSFNKVWMWIMNSIKSWMTWIKLLDLNAKPPLECMIPELQVSEV